MNSDLNKPRTLKNYFGVDTKSGHANNKWAARAEEGNLPKPERPTPGHKLKEYLQNNILAWFIHDWRVKRPFRYPDKIDNTSIYDIDTAGSAGGPVTIALIADWGTYTEQSQFVGEKVLEKNPAYTIHLGDTYYSGKGKELADNFGTDPNTGIWPRGKIGSFALPGNHEMFSSGKDFLNMITNRARGFGILKDGLYSGQPAPCFCLRTKHWCILGLDTAYYSLVRKFPRLNPNNKRLTLPEPVINWLKDVVKLKEETRGIIVLTHHQYTTGFNKESEYPEPARQLQEIIPGREVLWIWGHEHRFAMYGKYSRSENHITAFGRCIGNGGMPTELKKKRVPAEDRAMASNLVLYDQRLAYNLELEAADEETGLPAWNQPLGYNGYALININGDKATVSYYAAFGVSENNISKDDKLIEEEWAVTSDGSIELSQVTDYLKDNLPGERLTYFGAPEDPRRVGNSLRAV